MRCVQVAGWRNDGGGSMVTRSRAEMPLPTNGKVAKEDNVNLDGLGKGTGEVMLGMRDVFR